MNGGSTLDVAIVGAGAGGTYLADRLAGARPKWAIKVFERSSRIGGRLRSVQIDGLAHPMAFGGAQEFAGEGTRVGGIIELDVINAADIVLPQVVIQPDDLDGQHLPLLAREFERSADPVIAFPCRTYIYVEHAAGFPEIRDAVGRQAVSQGQIRQRFCAEVDEGVVRNQQPADALFDHCRKGTLKIRDSLHGERWNCQLQMLRGRRD